MKDLKLWQKAGLVVAIVGGLTLGGITPKYDSKNLESKLPSIGMSVAEAKEVKTDGYEIPDLTGLTPSKTFYEEDKETGIIPSERFEMSRTQLDDDYYLLTGMIHKEGYTPEDITIRNDMFCEKKGHHVRELEWYFFKHMQRSYTLYEYRFLGKYSPKIYCIENLQK